MRFIFFTKTEWNEPARIRHQLAQLLIEKGHSVVFFQKARLAARKRVVVLNSQLTLLRHGHLLHHQLKFLGPLRWLDEAFLRRQICSLLSPEADDVIVSFNYDYHFLSAIFPKSPIIHVVNDDFLGTAIRLSRKTAAWLQEQTVRKSHHTLCVSYSLLSRVQEWTSRCSLFLPWARRAYATPPDHSGRTEVLYWGYINDRIDYRVVGGLLSAGIKINFVGQVTPSRQVDDLLRHDNASYLGAANLEDVPEVLARCSCTILPYETSQPVNRAITMANRGFALLSFGLPLLYSNLPHVMTDAPARVIYRCTSVTDFVRAIEDTRAHFTALQPNVRAFLEGHYADQRYEQFMNVVASAEVAPLVRTDFSSG